MSSDPDPGNQWYELFSRGSRDWLRHSDKIREAVRDHLPQIIANSDIGDNSARTVRVPVRVLEHYRFKLRHDPESKGVGQGIAKPGDLLGPATANRKPGGNGPGGTERGGAELQLEFKVDDIIDWMWEELRLPNLQHETGNPKIPNGNVKAGIAVEHDLALIDGVPLKSRSSAGRSMHRRPPSWTRIYAIDN